MAFYRSKERIYYHGLFSDVTPDENVKRGREEISENRSMSKRQMICVVYGCANQQNPEKTNSYR